LTAVLWDSVAERPAVEREVLQLINPDARAALDLRDAVERIEAELESKQGQSREHLSEWAIKEANAKLTRAAKDLAAMRERSAASGRSVTAIDDAIARAKAVHGRVLVEALGIDASMVAAQLGGQA
jgi:MoxR-like ATPase